MIASASVINPLLSLRWFRCSSNLSSDTRWMINGHHVPEEVARPACPEHSNSRGPVAFMPSKRWRLSAMRCSAFISPCTLAITSDEEYAR